jgi:BirA family biotin operon repressor/biotin-[acetyl-CoA-carboxylase] ligase
MSRAQGLRQALLARGVSWPAELDWRPRVSSTNDVLKQRAREGAPEWTTVLADTQTGGRGRGGRTWESPPGGLYLSVLLRPLFEATSLLPLAAGLAVVEMTLEHGVEGELKWPNDVEVRGRKVAGVLTEASSSSVGVDWAVVGMGVNVSTPRSALSPSLGQSATSLALESGATPSVEEAAAGVLTRLSIWYDALQRRPASVVEAWRQRAVGWWGSQVQVHTVQGGLEGILREVDETGALVVELEGGECRRLLTGEVTRVRRASRGS